VSARAYVAVLLIDLHFPEAGSLKGKRKELQSVKAQLQRRFGASVAEVDHHDRWQRATLMASVCGGTAGRVQEGADGIARWLDGRFPAGVSVATELASLEDLRNGPSRAVG